MYTYSITLEDGTQLEYQAVSMKGLTHIIHYIVNRDYAGLDIISIIRVN